jgi:hypothetical protein
MKMAKIDMRKPKITKDSIDSATPSEWDAVAKSISEAVHHPPHYSKGSIETIF